MAERRVSLLTNLNEKSFSFFFYVVVILVSFKELSAIEAQTVPAEYVFGDSLVDVGNNNYISDTYFLADFPYNGIDFPTHQPTGRFSNGKNAADFLAEKVGLHTPPPYLSIKQLNSTSIYLAGLNFASGGSGILNTTNPEGPLSLASQVNDYVKVHNALLKELGYSAVQKHLSKSLFIIVSGNNDMLGYDKKNPQKYIDSIALTLKIQLQRLYNYGARKFVVAGVGLVGCVPSRRVGNNGQCMEEANKWSVKCNQGIKSLLKKLKAQLKINYSYFDTLRALNAVIQNPNAHGFVEVKAACCGMGNEQAEGPCLPISKLCPNRRDHVFWDFDHPAEATAQILVDSMFDGPLQYTSPISMRQLVAL